MDEKRNASVSAVPIRETPARAPSVASDAHVPLSQAAISGGLLAICVSCVIGLGIEAVIGLRAEHAPVLAMIGVMAFSALTTVFWFREKAEAQRSIWSREIAAGADIDGDGKIGKPHWVAVNSPALPAANSESAQQARFEEFVEFAYTPPGRTDIRSARKAGYTDDEWTMFMDALEAAGLVKRVRAGANAARRLTAPNAHACIMTARKRGMFVR